MQYCKQKCNGICTRPLIQAAGSKGRAAAAADTSAPPSCCCVGPVKESGSKAGSRSGQTQQYDDDAGYVHEYDSYGAQAQQEGGLLGAKVWGELFFNTQTAAAGAHRSSVVGKAVWSMQLAQQMGSRQLHHQRARHVSLLRLD